MEVVWTEIELFEMFFGVSSINFRIIVHKKGIYLGRAKVKAIQFMEPPTTCKLLKSFMDRVPYVHRFIPALGELLKPFHNLLKKNVPFRLDEEWQKAF